MKVGDDEGLDLYPQLASKRNSQTAGRSLQKAGGGAASSVVPSLRRQLCAFRHLLVLLLLSHVQRAIVIKDCCRPTPTPSRQNHSAQEMPSKDRPRRCGRGFWARLPSCPSRQARTHAQLRPDDRETRLQATSRRQLGRCETCRHLGRRPGFRWGLQPHLPLHLARCLRQGAAAPMDRGSRCLARCHPKKSAL